MIHMMFNLRIAKEVGTLVDSLNNSSNELSKMHADYLSMETSDEKWGPHMISCQLVIPCNSTLYIIHCSHPFQERGREEEIGHGYLRPLHKGGCDNEQLSDPQ